MISSLHYYGLFDTTKSNKINRLPYKKAIENNKSKSLKLDTAYKKDIISYAKDLSQSVNETKTISYELINDISKLITNESDDATNKKYKTNAQNSENTKKNNKQKEKDKSSLLGLNLSEHFGNSLNRFTEALNKTINFKESSSQSKSFDDFSENISDMIKYSPSLNELGISFKDGSYHINQDAINNLSVDDAKNLLVQSYEDISKIYNETKNFLSVPLSDHMAFKNFSYYYSYSAGVMQNNSFNLFGTGTLINLKL